jgi:hypothetical protein
MATVGQNIKAVDYNNVQTTIANILGPAATGYGQVLQSGQVAVTAKVLKSDFNALQNDITTTFFHQLGTAPSPVLTTATTSTKITAADWNAYSTMASALANQSPNSTGGVSYPGCYKTIAGNQYNTPGVTNGVSAIQGFPHQAIRDGNPRPWGGTTVVNTGSGYNFTFGQSNIPIVSETVSVNWTGNSSAGYTAAQAAQYFFNSGGQLTFNASLGGPGSTPSSTLIPTPTGGKNYSWYLLLNSMQTITFDYNGVTTTGSGTGSSYGWNYLQGQKGQPLVPIFTASVGAAGSSQYAPNQYTIWAGLNSGGNSLTFQIMFEDLSSGIPVQQGTVSSVAGTNTITLSSTVNLSVGTVIFFTGTGSNGISVSTVPSPQPYYIASVNTGTNQITIATSYNNATAAVPTIVNTLSPGTVGSMSFQAAGTEEFFNSRVTPYDIDEDVTGYLVSNVNMNYAGGTGSVQMYFTSGGNTYNYLPTISAVTVL